MLELGEAEYMVRATRLPEDRSTISAAIPLDDERRPACRCCWATSRACRSGPEMRRGIAELDGEGEVAGGIIVMRSGKNALETIDAVKAKLAAAARPACPQGVEIVADLRPLRR